MTNPCLTDIPQACIGVLGRVQRISRFDAADPNTVAAMRIISMSLSAHHRVVDGGTIAWWSEAYLENHAQVLANMR